MIKRKKSRENACLTSIVHIGKQKELGFLFTSFYSDGQAIFFCDFFSQRLGFQQPDEVCFF